MFNVVKFTVQNQFKGAPIPLYLGYSLDVSGYTSAKIRPPNSYYLFKYTLSGYGDIADIEKNVNWRLPSGTAMFIKFPSTRFIFSTPKGCDEWEGIYFEFYAEQMESIINTLIDNVGVKFALSPDSHLIRKMLAWYKQYSDGGTINIDAFEATQLVCQLIGELRESKDKKNVQHHSLVRNACTFIDDHLDQPVNVSEIANALSVTRSHLSRIFMRQFNVTIHDYIVSAKLRRVCQLLVEGKLSNEEIAYRCGYASSIQFYRQFKQRIGMSPGEFRKSPEQEEIFRSI